MGTVLEVKVLYGSLLEETMSRRQLHETERRAARCWKQCPTVLTREVGPLGVSARSCGMEARDEPQHRAKAKLRKADVVWVSARPGVTPSFQTRRRGSGDGCGGTHCALTRGELRWSGIAGRRGGGNDDPPMPKEKSDHLVVVMKPGNAGGAKGVTG